MTTTAAATARAATTHPAIDQKPGPSSAFAAIAAKAASSPEPVVPEPVAPEPVAPCPVCPAGCRPGWGSAWAGVSVSAAGGMAGPTVPSAYVGITVNTIRSAAGSGPSATARSADLPGCSGPLTASQVIDAAVSVTGVPPWMLVSGVASFLFSICGAQSSTDSGKTSATGVSAGMTSFTLVIARGPVFLTSRCTFAPLPCGALGGLTVTSARAGPAVPTTPAATAAASTPARREMRVRLTTCGSDRMPGWFNGS